MFGFGLVPNTQYIRKYGIQPSLGGTLRPLEAAIWPKPNTFEFFDLAMWPTPNIVPPRKMMLRMFFLRGPSARASADRLLLTRIAVRFSNVFRTASAELPRAYAHQAKYKIPTFIILPLPLCIHPLLPRRFRAASAPLPRNAHGIKSSTYYSS